MFSTRARAAVRLALGMVLPLLFCGAGSSFAAQPHYLQAYDGALQGTWSYFVWDLGGPVNVNLAASAPGRTGNAIEVTPAPGNAYWAFGLQDVKPGNDQQWKYMNEMRTVEFDIYFEPGSTGVEDILLWPTGNYNVPSSPHLIDLIPGWATMTNAQRYGQWFHITLDMTQWQPGLKAFAGILIASWGNGAPHYRVADVKLGWADDATAPVLTTGTTSYDSTAHSLTLNFTTDEPTVCAIEYGVGNYNTRVWSDDSRNWDTFDAGDHQNLTHSAVLPFLIPGATYQYRIIAMDHRTDATAVPNRATSTGSYTVPGPPYTPPTPPALTYVWAYQNALLGYWVRSAWEQNGPLYTDFNAAAPGRSGKAIEVRFDPTNLYEAVGVGERRDGWDNQWKFFNEFRTLEFDVYFEPDSAGHESFMVYMDDAGLADNAPYLTDLIPGWLEMTPAQKFGQWIHITVDLQQMKPKWPAFSGFLLYNNAGAVTTHFRLEDIKAGWATDTTPPGITLTTNSLSFDYQQYTLNFTTDESAVTQVDYGIGSYANTVQVEANGWAGFSPATSPYTSHGAVLTGLTPNTTYQYRIVAKDHRTDVNATPNQGVYTGSFTVPPAPTTPPTLSPITVTDITGNRATLSWTVERPSTAVVTYQKADGQVVTRTLSSFQSSQSIVLDLIEPLTAYTVTVAVTDSFHFTSTGGTSFTTTAAAAPTVTITADPAHTLSISKWIYGINDVLGYDAQGTWNRLLQRSIAPRNLTLGRYGGNRWTAYNWENNASNAGFDYFYQSDDFLGGGSVPAEAVRDPVADLRTHGMATLITVPMLGYVAGDKSGPVDLNDPNHLATRFKQLVYRKGSAFTATPSTTDAFVYADEFVWALRNQFSADIYGDAQAPTFISLDNEPDLWPSTHAEITHTAVNSDTFIQKTIDLSSAIKDAAPTAVIFGPVNYGFLGMYNWQTEGGFSSTSWFTDKFLLALKAASQSAGHRLVDVYDMHWYVDAVVPGTSTGIGSLRGPTLSAAEIDAIVQNPRSLWDSSYQESSWITRDVLGGPIAILNRIQAKIDADWPGTKLAVTEYNTSGDNHIAGTIAQCDYLGIFGQKGIYAANFWPMSPSYPFLLAGFKMYRDYDGNLGSFGDICVPTTSSDTSKVSTYISKDSTNVNRHVIVAINRSQASQDVAFNGMNISGTARVYRLQGASTTPVFVGEVPADLSSWVVTLPALSVSTIEITAPSLSPIETWRLAKFGSSANSGSGADMAMPAHDGIPNLMKYALNLEPFTPSRHPISTDTSSGNLRLTVTRNPAATDVTYAVEISTDLSNPAGWTTVGTTVEVNTSTTLQVRDSLPIGTGGPRRFMRVKVVRP
ncbi:glycoside hydrolase family 44 protein [Prosthecobacter sp.]|uniref:glycoside hydrolase family 44 protein n=1 Tax=Prosthecobacter sp. TaxID=1965333 RepID=UPI0037830CB8